MLISKEEADQLNQEYTLSVLKRKINDAAIQKSVQMEGTAKPLPVSTRPTNQDWQMHAGDVQAPVTGGQADGLNESGPTNPANPVVPVPGSYEEYSQSLQNPSDLVRLEWERNEAKRRKEEAHDQYRESRRRFAEAEEVDELQRKLESKIEELRAKSAEVPPAAEGAVPVVIPEDAIQSPYLSLDEIEAANQNDPSKLAASPGLSGSSGVYITGSNIVSLKSPHPELEKGFKNQNRLTKTYCKTCSVEVSSEGDEEHWKRTGHAHFRKA